MKVQYRGIDLLKFICALLVLVLHVSPFPDGSFLRVVFREVVCIFAVPFFFAASGYLMTNKLTDKDMSVLSVIKRPYLLYLIWSALYFPLVLFSWFISENSVFSNFIVYIRDFLFEGSYLTIWYLNALAIALGICHLLLKRFSPRMCLLIALPFYAVACLLSSYNQLLVSNDFGLFASDIYYAVFIFFIR